MSPPASSAAIAIVVTTIAINATAVMGGAGSVRPTTAPYSAIAIAAAGGGWTAIAIREVLVARSPSCTSTSGGLDNTAALRIVATPTTATAMLVAHAATAAMVIAGDAAVVIADPAAVVIVAAAVMVVAHATTAMMIAAAITSVVIVSATAVVIAGNAAMVIVAATVVPVADATATMMIAAAAVMLVMHATAAIMIAGIATAMVIARDASAASCPSSVSMWGGWHHS
jgi:hypothetical protein